MSKNIYHSSKGNQTVMEVAGNNTRLADSTIHAKRVDIVSVKMVKESSMLYKERKISSPKDAYKLIKEFLEYEDREMLIVCLLVLLDFS